MSLAPTLSERLARARGDLRLGVPVVLQEPAGTAVMLAAETVTPHRLAALRRLGRPVLAITAWRATTLKARAYDGDLARIPLPDEADTAWITAVADPADDLRRPLKGPLMSDRGGEAALHRAALTLAKGARLLPAALLVPVDDGAALARAQALTLIEVAAAHPVLEAVAPMTDVVSGRVPLPISQAARVHVFRPADGGEEHFAAEIGRPPRDGTPLARLHSACFTGDVLGSLKCDCGPQLRGALAQIGAEGAGLLLYLNQEGRGIGLANKMRAYALQDQGFDTVEANHRLGFEDDERDFRIGAAILRQMGFAQVRLLTNNPAKVAMLRAHGVEVIERVALKPGRGPLNERYLDTKARKSGHIL